ncbi:adenosylcobinamide-GDP ribazoletransferase, partial [Citrobacter freundii]|uniref:adenosylcobinamide-GDP ribazoletransferase n=1 Tax=Citrobacter freundii TaxID=546 RepID=UPI001954534B
LAVWAQPLGPLLLSLVAAAAVAALMRQWLMRRLGGYTGDGLGATEQLAEIAVLLALTVSL